MGTTYELHQRVARPVNVKIQCHLGRWNAPKTLPVRSHRQGESSFPGQFLSRAEPLLLLPHSLSPLSRLCSQSPDTEKKATIICRSLL